MTEIERQLEADLVAATRGKLPELTVLRSLKSALHNERISKKVTGDLKDEDIVTVFRRELKKRTEAAAMYQKGGRHELEEAEKTEARIIERYLPKMPAPEEIKQVMLRLKQEQGLAGIQAMGPLTKAAVAHFKGAVDGKTISELSREILSQG